MAGWLAMDFRHLFLYLLGSKRVTRVAGAGCHSVGVAAAGWLEFGMNTGVCGELKSRKHLMMASGKWGPLAWPMFR